MPPSLLRQETPPSALPSGRHYLTSDEAGSHQQHRILFAMVHVAGEDGYDGATVMRVARSARVAERSVYNHYPTGRKEVLVTAYRRLGLEVVARACSAAAAEESFEAMVRAALTGMLRALEADPEAARFLLVEAPGGGGLYAGDVRVQLLRRFADVLHRAVTARGLAFTPGPETALLVVGGIHHVLTEVVRDRPQAKLTELAEDLIEVVLTYYR